MDVVLKIIERVDVGQYGLCDMLVVVQDLIERIGREVVSGLQVQKLAEGESSQVV